MSDEPRIAKYGMPASESQRFHASHAVVMQERALFKELRFQHALRVGPGLRAALDALAGECAASAPIAADAPLAVDTAPVAADPVDLRAALGLK